MFLVIIYIHYLHVPPPFSLVPNSRPNSLGEWVCSWTSLLWHERWPYGTDTQSFTVLSGFAREVWKNITLSIHKEGPSKICFPVDFGSGLDCAVCHCHFQQRIGLSVPARSTGLRAEQCFVGAVSVSLCKYSFGHCTDAQCIDYCFCELLVVFVHVFVLPNDDSEFANSLVCTQPPKRTTEINKYYHKMTDGKSTRRIIMKIHRYPQYH